MVIGDIYYTYTHIIVNYERVQAYFCRMLVQQLFEGGIFIHAV